MNYKESIAYNKDLITGKIFTENKIKPITPLTNTVTIEMFDKRKNKIYEAKSENIVNDVVAKMAYMNHFYRRIKGDGFGFYSDPNTLCLTDYTGVEDSAIQYMKGNLIGYIGIRENYNGADTLKGSYNSAESSSTVDNITKKARLHYVYDFPTNAANGTFQTIWYNNYTNATCQGTRLKDQNWLGYINPCIKDNIIYFPYYGTMYKFNLSTNAMMSTVTLNGGTGGYGSITTDGTYFYLSCKDGGQFYFDKFDTSFNFVSSKTFSNITTGSIYGTHFMDNKFYVLQKVSGTESYLKTYNISLDPIDDIRLDFDIDTGYLTQTNEGHLMLEGRVINTSGKSIAKYNWGQYAYYRYMAAYNPSDGKHYALGTDNYICEQFFCAPVTQCKLASPVTKTNTNTMKIQYDFVIDLIDEYN